MSRAKIMLLVCVVLVFAAGAAVGRLTTRSLPGDGPRSWLTDELSLTAEQREEMHEIWSGAMESRSNPREERQRLLRERDESIRGLLSDTQRTDYDKILAEHAAQLDEMSAKRQAAFDGAVARTREILTAQQRVKYDEMRDNMP